ncbi:alpha/beta fold hydrolase [Streptomyces sp. JNUCC 64]
MDSTDGADGTDGAGAEGVLDAIVFGGTGFIGRSLVAELLRRGQRVAATVRVDTLTPWLRARGVGTDRLTVFTADITRPLGGLPRARDVYNAAALFAFGLDPARARAVNVTGALQVVEWAAARPGTRRLVHISGYRVGAEGDRPGPAGTGAYEASKTEADRAVRARAAALGVPLTVANPSTVIGPGQYLGLASLVARLWDGHLPAYPGGTDTFVPVVTVDHLARFLAEIPGSPPGDQHWILDDATPPLPALLATVADHTGVRAPRRGVPVALLRRLPRRMTGVDPETLSFLSADRYPTDSARELAAAVGLEAPPVADALRSWADDLVAARFGDGEPWLAPYGFRAVAGSRTWTAGDRLTPRHVLLHGLPLNSDVWEGVVARLPGPALVADLPGLGRSSPAAGGTDAWLAGLLAPVRTRPVLVAHSAACGAAVRFAVAHPERIGGLVLVSPAFLQAPGSRLHRSPLAVAALRRTSAARLAGLLGAPEGPAVAGAVADLRRPGVARRVVAALRSAHGERAAVRALLERVGVPVRIVTGSADPLAGDGGRPVTEIAGAGHHPQLTHPDALARAVGEPLVPADG